MSIFSVSAAIALLSSMYMTTADAQAMLGCPGQVFVGVEDNGKIQVTLDQRTSTYTSTSIAKTAKLASFFCANNVFNASLINATDTNNCTYTGNIVNGTIPSGTQSCVNGIFNFSGTFQ